VPKSMLARIVCLVLLFAVVVFSIAEAAGIMHMRAIAPHVLDGGTLGIGWAGPFAGLLFSIAFLPMLAPVLWQRHYGKVSFFWGMTFLLPFALRFGGRGAVYEVLNIFVSDYMPFMALLVALYVVGGGIRLVGHLRGNPVSNSAMLVLGLIAAGWMGTTGASMLFIRPILEANSHRKYRAHIVVFFIFLVSNIGGIITPLGDPPLFMGFLRGVSFFWPTVFLMKPFLVASFLLLVAFFVVDTFLWLYENHSLEDGQFFTGKLGLEGKVNILLLALIVGSVILPGMWKSGVVVTIGRTDIAVEYVVSDLFLCSIAMFSWALTGMSTRIHNEFHWEPMIEVGKLFAGIFITMVPVIAMLQAGVNGPFGAVERLVTTGDSFRPGLFYLMTGMLSGFLDNTPTYLAFFNLAGGHADVLMWEHPQVLVAISCGAVFMGALTYIGNAPNFMVRAIAEQRGVKMPGFFGYMLWSLGILAPVLAVVGVVCFM